MRRIGTRLVLALATIGASLGITAVPVAADVESVTGSASGTIAAPLEPAQPTVSFSNPGDGPGPFTASLASMGAGGIFAAGGMVVTTSQFGVLGTTSAGAQSTADVAVAAYLVDVIVGQQIHSECQATGTGASGSTVFGTASFSENLVFSGRANFTPAPNTTVNTGFGETIVFNEQISLDDGLTVGIVVNAMRITRGALNIIVGQTVCTATNASTIGAGPGGNPHTTLTVLDDPSSFANVPRTFTYVELNDGTNPISNITITDDQCSPVTFVGSSLNNDAILDPGESWTFWCTATFDFANTFTSNVVAVGTDTVTGLPHVEQASLTFSLFPMGPFWDEASGMWIDPSGAVCASSDAELTLLRSPRAQGPFDQVPAGSTIMSPDNRRNPDRPGPDGRFRWDVVPGFYVVRLTSLATGESVDSAVLPIPPEVTNLDLRLSCPVAPRAQPPAATPARVTLTG